MTSCTVYRKFSHILLMSPFICPFFSLSNSSGITSDGYRRGYVSFAHFLLYLGMERNGAVKALKTSGDLIDAMLGQ